MANVSHATLAGADLHEPKGIGAALLGTVYIADGVGSGAWSSASAALSFTGQIADFATPVVPSGWLECDGTTVSRATFPALFTAVTIQQTGTRTNGSPTITGLSSTTNMRAGYFIGGTGIVNGTTILSVDGPSQVTMSANASSSGSATVIVSPFALGDGTTTFTLPNVTTSGRYRRSRTSSVQMGVSQADQNLTHTHTASNTSNGAHSHTINITDPGHVHAHAKGAAGTTASGNPDHDVQTWSNPLNTGSNVTGITAAAVAVADHTHTITVNATGSGEARPLTLVIMTCIRT